VLADGAPLPGDAPAAKVGDPLIKEVISGFLSDPSSSVPSPKPSATPNRPAVPPTAGLCR